MRRIDNPERCPGVLDNGQSPCNEAIYQCANCERKGCFVNGCSNRQFVPVELCKDCGHAYEMLPVREKTKSTAGATPTTAPAVNPYWYFIVMSLLGVTLGLLAALLRRWGVF